MTKLLNTLLDLLKIDAVAKHERPVADYLIRLFRKLGVDLQEDDTAGKIGGDAGNLYAMIEGAGEKAPLAILAHMDTVSGTRELQPVVTQTEIHTNGKSVLGGDNRAGVFLICELVRRLKENKIRHCPIEIIFTVAEEIGLLGIKNIDYAKIRSQNAFVLDAGGHAGTIVTKAPSLEKLSILVKGKSAHAGAEPEKGVNAIAIASHAVANIKQGRKDAETTLNIGKIEGGIATNIVPDKVSLEGEIRSFNTDTLIKEVEKTRQKFKESADAFGGEMDFTHTLSFSTFNLALDKEPVMMAKMAAEKLGLVPFITHSGGGSDANVLNANNITSVGLGCGVFNAHTKDEYIVLDDLYKSLDWLAGIVELAKR